MLKNYKGDEEKTRGRFLVTLLAECALPLSEPFEHDEGQDTAWAAATSFGKACWEGSVAEALTRGRWCVYITGPHPKCNELITPAETSKSASELVLEKFGLPAPLIF